jgi:ABC-type branched-subunit amino acid transport system substrate-binding protein
VGFVRSCVIVRHRTWLLAALLLLTACSRGSARTDADELLVIVSVPVTQTPWVANFASRGAFLAAEQINDSGGVDAGGRKRRVRVDVMDNAASPATAADVAREAVQRGAAALITDGTGAAAVAQVTGPARLPTFVVWEGGDGIVGPDKPTIFRMAPANRPMATRLADYISGQRPKVAVIHDDSSYGRDGKAALDVAFERNEIEVVTTVEVPQAGTGVEPAVVRARSAGARLLVVWARAPVVTSALGAARESGWNVPVYTGPTGEDPLVRERLGRRPEWVDGLTFVSFRITAEIGPEPFEQFRAAYEKRYRPDRTIRDKQDELVTMPPDWAIYSYDSLHLVTAALQRSGGALGEPLLQQLNQVSITGANGDERGFTEANHEGVSPDDMYFGRFDNMRFAPVKDDILSEGLPTVPQ